MSSQGTVRKRFNPKRRITDSAPDQLRLDGLADRVRYVGSPLHKRNPGDFKLVPPAHPRPHKTLCDDAGVIARDDAERWLREGVRKGMVSAQESKGFPQNIWAVTDAGVVLEARLDNSARGTYHGYPLLKADPFRALVLTRWNPA